MNINQKLLNIQQKLKAPKNQQNSFGNYSYRSCEDIFEAVKPYLLEFNALLTVSDEVVLIGDRFYVKATASIRNMEDDGCIETTAYAREGAEKKGMDVSQLTGATSSYARKYALNGLFAIDDNKDSDAKAIVVDKDRIKQIYTLAKQKNITDIEIHDLIWKRFQKTSIKALTDEEFDFLIYRLDTAVKKENVEAIKSTTKKDVHQLQPLVAE